MTTDLLDYSGYLTSQVGDLAVRYEQEITDEFLRETKEARAASSHAPMGDYHKVASIPAAVADVWKRQGFDVFTAPAREILKRLREENLDAFITTTKRV